MYLQYLNNLIKDNITNDKIETIINNDTNEEVSEPSINNFNNHEKNFDITDWTHWSDTVLESAQKIAEKSEYGSIINACYNPKFAKQMKTRLLPYVPVSTGVMRLFFKRSGEIATSSAIEEFSDIKSRGFKGQLPMRVDKFVIQHLDLLDAKITLASNRKDKSNIDISNNTLLTSNEQNITHDDLNENNITNSSTVSINEKYKSKDENNKYREPSLQNISDIIDSIKSTSEMSIKSMKDAEYAADNVNVNDTSSFEINVNKPNNLDEKDVWNICENWHGLTKLSSIAQECLQPLPAKRKASYLDICPKWDFVKK